MKRTIEYHDETTGIAQITFEHNDVKLTDTYDLIKVIPGSEQILKEMNIAFTTEHQMTVIQRLTDTIERQINEGVITNPPETPTTEYVAPPGLVEPTVPSSKKKTA